MFGPTQDPPLTTAVLYVAIAGALLLLAGALTAPRWPLPRALVVRRIAGALGVAVPVAHYLLAPPETGLEGVARMVFIGPCVVLSAALWIVWMRRDEMRPGPGL